jgi:hypothetical protein
MTYSTLVKHPLADTLAVLLPAPEVTMLLCGCLDKGQSGKRACESWLADHTEFGNQPVEEVTKAFLPLLFEAIRAHGIDVPANFGTILRTAAWREELRTRTYRQICRNVFTVLKDQGMPAIVLKGAALAETVYSDPALRHSHDIEILVEHPELDEIVDLLTSRRFAPPSRKASRTDSGDIELIHESGLPLILHRKLFPIPFYNAALLDICSRAQIATICDIPVRVLSPADALLHTCGHAVYSPSRESFRWIADAWFIIRKHPDLDWDLLLDCARRSHLVLPLSVMCDYLSKDLNAPIPRSFLDRLSFAASRNKSIEGELALFGARSSPRGGFRNLIRKTRNWSGRALIIKWMVFPSPAYVRWISQTRGLWLFLQYFYRPINYVSRRTLPTLKSVLRRIVIGGRAKIVNRSVKAYRAAGYRGG